MLTMFPKGEGILIKVNDRLFYEIRSFQFFPEEKPSENGPGVAMEVELDQVYACIDEYEFKLSYEATRIIENLYYDEIMKAVLDRRKELYNDDRTERELAALEDSIR